MKAPDADDWKLPDNPTESDIRDAIHRGIAGPRAQADLIAGEAERLRLGYNPFDAVGAGDAEEEHPFYSLCHCHACIARAPRRWL